MTIFVAVADAGSLTAASRALGVPLPTVSRRLGELESFLKTRLLHRTTRQVSLTEAGSSYLASCRRLLAEIGEAERMASDEYATPRGELTITAPVVFGRLHMLPVVAKFLAHYPDISVNLVLTDNVVHLMEEHTDVAVRIGFMPDSTLVAVGVGSVRRVVCASPAYLIRSGVPHLPRDLAKHNCINFEVLASKRAWVFGDGRSKEAVPVRARFTVNTAEAAIDSAILGIGLVRVLSYQVAQAIRENTLVIVLADHESAPLPVSLVHIGQAPAPLKLRAFLNFVAPLLRQNLERLV